MARTEKRTDRRNKKEEQESESQPQNIGMQLTLIYFAILFGMTFVFLAAPPAHSAPIEIVITK